MGLDDDGKMQLRSSKHNWDVGVAKSCLFDTARKCCFKFSDLQNM